ncbi:thioesterase family protein [Rhodococcus pseudokoreensis]|uniref:Thioesterase family protein n=1 Tax=Rhodococcus pseudokoreensis TaxID=2811421 RepID=A0A974ZTM7_9NOCA|nr:acyl-CoA thioesterase domain-containing protein [Rhodococcus pseudokoreensis]QSE89844.1 thioesterase family protein [Rhodococcus pseudokoreensis]
MIASAEQLESLVDALRVTPTGGNRFHGPTAVRRLPRLFGGQVLAQAVMAAGATVPEGRYPHSLHTLFLRGGNPEVPVSYQVTVLRDGRSFSARLVTATQGDAVLATLQLSFATEQSGPEHEWSPPLTETAPDELLPLYQRLEVEFAALPAWWSQPHPFDFRFLEHPEALAAAGTREPEQRFWVRAAAQVPDEPLLHAALLAYVSDLTLLDPALMPHGRSWYGNRVIAGASIDHAMWFHRQFSMNDWMLCRQTSPIATGGRCLCTCDFTTEAGARIASATQEGVLREP